MLYMGPLIFAYLPILVLIFLMTKKQSMPSARALPLVAILVYALMLVVFRREANQVHAEVLSGLLVAWTPILIIAGAIFLFRTMEATGSLSLIRQWLNKLTGNQVAQVMIVGWAFSFLIEGASGFGTPAAIAAPILVGLGFPPVRVAILVLVMNSIPVSFGGVGTPTWFGFSPLGLSELEMLQIGFKSALINSVAALLIPFMALTFVIKAKSVLKNWLFILLSILLTVGPHLVISRFSYEFPSLIGGAVGLVATILLAKYRIGLSQAPVETHERVGESQLSSPDPVQVTRGKELNTARLIKATFPLWGTVLVLLITRLPQLGIKDWLTSTLPSLNLGMGSLGTISISPSLVVSLHEIFGTDTSWSHPVLYIPSILPFGLISVLTFLIYKKSGKDMGRVWGSTVRQMKKPTQALLGALVFVNLMMMGGDQSAVALIGDHLAGLSGDSWTYVASLLGALGSFFSGSATISNLSFGGIQDAIATQLQLNRTSLLAIQSVGGAMGNMVCINNIVAVASVLALGNMEGYILKRTVRVLLVYAAVVALMALLLP